MEPKMMKISTNYATLQSREQRDKYADRGIALREPIDKAADKMADKLITKKTGIKMRTRLKAYLEEIKDLQQQLSKLQDEEASLKEKQKLLIRKQGDQQTFPPLKEFETLEAIQKTQKVIKDQLTEKLVAKENVMANLVAIREKELAKSIMRTVKNCLISPGDSSMASQIQLQQESILGLLK
jgi:seryl-tRNA synthetase